MTTERGQLELAAKACGLYFNPTVKLKQGLRVVKTDAKCQSNQTLWNPASDDGDCARMEAQLDLDINWHSGFVKVCSDDNQFAVEHFLDHAGDKNAARRAASVAVASEIGRLIPHNA